MCSFLSKSPSVMKIGSNPSSYNWIHSGTCWAGQCHEITEIRLWMVEDYTCKENPCSLNTVSIMINMFFLVPFSPCRRFRVPPGLLQLFKWISHQMWLCSQPPMEGLCLSHQSAGMAGRLISQDLAEERSGEGSLLIPLAGEIEIHKEPTTSGGLLLPSALCVFITAMINAIMQTLLTSPSLLYTHAPPPHIPQGNLQIHIGTPMRCHMILPLPVETKANSSEIRDQLTHRQSH